MRLYSVYDGKLKGAETPTVELCCYWFHINIFGPFSLRSPAIYLYNLYNTTKMPTNSFKLDFLHHLGNEEKNTFHSPLILTNIYKIPDFVRKKK